MSKTDKPFTRSYDELVELGLPVRLVLVYGKLDFMAGDKGECWPTQATLAKKCGLEIRQLQNVLDQLRRLKLIAWKRGRYYNFYRPLKPDTQWIAHLTRKELRISDTQRSAYRKESESKRTTEKNSPYGRDSDYLPHFAQKRREAEPESEQHASATTGNGTANANEAALEAIMRKHLGRVSTASLQRVVAVAPHREVTNETLHAIEDAVVRSPKPPTSVKWFIAVVKNYYREQPWYPPAARTDFNVV